MFPGCKKEKSVEDGARTSTDASVLTAKAKPVAPDASAPLGTAADASAAPTPSKEPTEETDKQAKDPKEASTTKTPTPKSRPKPTPKEEVGLPSHGKKCASGGKCAAGLECISYYGIAGANGPKFTSCERRCGKGHKPCPGSMRCAVIADGPGQVCR